MITRYIHSKPLGSLGCLILYSGNLIYNITNKYIRMYVRKYVIRKDNTSPLKNFTSCRMNYHQPESKILNTTL